jgi:hypothetical protein
MGVYPKNYTKKDFLKFLKKNNVKNSIITKFLELPDTININNNIFKINIDCIWYSIGDTYYTFELNYYSENLIEFFFKSRAYNDIEVSINFLMCELINNKFIIKKEYE